MNKSKFGTIEYLAIAVCVILALAIAVVLALTKGQSSDESSSSVEDYVFIDLLSKESEDLSVDDSSDEQSVAEEIPFDVFEVETDFMYKGDLVLVNRENHYTFKDETPVVDVYDVKNGKYKIGTGSEKLFEKTILYANEFLGDFYDLSGLKNVTMINGYISEEQQQKKYEAYIKNASSEDAAKWGVKAGASDHHTGLSFNLMLYPSGGKIGEGDYAWLTENACRYGFILRYPQEKSDITSVKDDNHFRYVGIPHAEYMYKNSLTLEEYISELEKTNYSSPMKYMSGNDEYIIYFSPADTSSSKTEIKVPKGYTYTCSGNNVNGFIITAYKE